MWIGTIVKNNCFKTLFTLLSRILFLFTMPKGTKLTEFEKSQILAFASVGKTHSEISTLVNRSRKVISTFLKDPSSYGIAKHTGRPSKLSVRDKKVISRSASNTTKSCTSIRN